MLAEHVLYESRGRIPGSGGSGFASARGPRSPATFFPVQFPHNSDGQLPGLRSLEDHAPAECMERSSIDSVQMERRRSRKQVIYRTNGQNEKQTKRLISKSLGSKQSGASLPPARGSCAAIFAEIRAMPLFGISSRDPSGPAMRTTSVSLSCVVGMA